MSRAVAVASGSAGVQAATGAVSLRGYSVRENAATAAAATVVLRDGTSSTAPARAFIELAADASETVTIPATDFESGVFVDREAGTSELVLYMG